jgi:DNA repair photolyase
MSKEGVTVGVRVRPLLPEETQEEDCVRVEGGRLAVTGSHRLRQFSFQHLLDRNAPQQQVF